MTSGAEVSRAELVNIAGHLAPLDGIRAIAVALVVAAHYQAPIGGGVGSFGVTVFFFLSGFLISRLLFVESNASGGHIRVGAFYARRFLRLLPALLLFLLVYSLVSTLYLLEPPRSGELWAGLFYYENYYWLWLESADPGASMRWGILWSLAVEEHFYLLFPAIFAMFHANRERFYRLILWVCLGVLVWRAVGIFTGIINERWTYLATDSRVDSILYGVALAAAIEVPALRPRLLGLMAQAWLMFPLALGALVLSLAVKNHAFKAIVAYSIQGVGLWLAFLLISFDGHAISRWCPTVLGTPVLRYMGRISYGIYLWHGACYRVVQRWAEARIGEPSLVFVATVALGVTLAVTSTSFFLVERYFLRLRHHFPPAHKVV